MDNNLNYFEQISRTSEIKVNKKFALNWTFIITFISPLVLTCIYFFLFTFGVSNPPSWVNWLFFVVFIPLITVALVLTQRKQLVGAYGETILVLIPTFVWLLPGHPDATKWLIIISFTIILLGGLSYSFGIFRRSRIHNPSTKSLRTTQIFLRLGFVAASVVSTVIVSVVLLEWADNSMHLANEKGSDTPNYSTGTWIFFIAAVTILDALLLVFLGLIANYETSKEKKNKEHSETKENDLKNINEIKKPDNPIDVVIKKNVKNRQPKTTKNINKKYIAKK